MSSDVPQERSFSVSAGCRELDRAPRVSCGICLADLLIPSQGRDSALLWCPERPRDQAGWPATHAEAIHARSQTINDLHAQISIENSAHLSPQTAGLP